MSVKIIQVNGCCVNEFDSVKEWAENNGSFPRGVGIHSAMLKMVKAMPDGTVAAFGGGWVLKGVKEVKFKS